MQMKQGAGLQTFARLEPVAQLEQFTIRQQIWRLEVVLQRELNVARALGAAASIDESKARSKAVLRRIQYRMVKCVDEFGAELYVLLFMHRERLR
jgi:hypothetical protein